MNCAEKLLEPTIFFNLYTKSPYTIHLYTSQTTKRLFERGEENDNMLTNTLPI